MHLVRAKLHVAADGTITGHAPPDLPLLFKGQDFARTDIRAAL